MGPSKLRCILLWGHPGHQQTGDSLSHRPDQQHPERMAWTMKTIAARSLKHQACQTHAIPTRCTTSALQQLAAEAAVFGLGCFAVARARQLAETLPGNLESIQDEHEESEPTAHQKPSLRPGVMPRALQQLPRKLRGKSGASTRSSPRPGIGRTVQRLVPSGRATSSSACPQKDSTMPKPTARGQRLR